MTNDNSHHIVENIDSITAPRTHRADLTNLPPQFIALSHVNYWRWVFTLGVVFLPFAMTACFTVATREWIIVDTVWDFLGWGLSMAAGLFCLWQLPLAGISRFLITLIYVPILSYLLLYFTLMFIGHRYGDWI